MEIKNIEKDEIKLIISCLEEKIKEITPLIFDTYEKKEKRKKIKKIIGNLESVIEADDIEIRRRNAPVMHWSTQTINHLKEDKFSNFYRFRHFNRKVRA